MRKVTRTYSSLLTSIGLAALLCSASPALGGLALAAAPSLGQAQSFGVLGGSTVTNTGSSAITGDLGVDPGNAITGFFGTIENDGPGTFTGTAHQADAVALGAHNDAVTAYNSLVGEPCNLNLTGTDLGGLTLTPGVYCFSSSAQLTGTLTLDARGNPNAVFVFKIGSTLTTASSSSVVMINGGSNCNVFWQVGSSATLGTTTTFIGDILASASITLNTGANVSGRAFALSGAVTMAGNHVSACAPLSCPTIAVAPSSGLPTVLPAGVVGSVYGTQTISASGGHGPYTFAVTIGVLPGGLGLTNQQPSSEDISGTPTTPGIFVFTITATDTFTGCTGSQQYTLQIPSAPSCPAISLSPTALPVAVLGTPYSQTITAAAIPNNTRSYTFSVSSGALPAGLTINPTTGVVSGTPTAVGLFDFTITATDTNECMGLQAYEMLLVEPTSAIPTLSGWGMIVLGALVALVGLAAIHRRGA
jgi:hypothetical protein